MDSADSFEKRPQRTNIEGDPADDYPEDQSLQENWDEEDDILDGEDRVVPVEEDVNRAGGETKEI